MGVMVQHSILPLRQSYSGYTTATSRKLMPAEEIIQESNFVQALLKDNKYALAGKLIAWSLLQGSPGPRCLSDEGYNLLCEQPYSCDAAIKDVSDEQLKLILHNIQKCAIKKDFATVIKKHGDEISSLGFSRIYLSKLNEKDDIVFGLLRQYYVFRVHAVIDQFFSGMDYLAGVGVIVRKHLLVFSSYFSTKVDSFTLLQFKALCKIFWSPDGSNARVAQESTIYCLEAYLQDREEKSRCHHPRRCTGIHYWC